MRPWHRPLITAIVAIVCAAPAAADPPSIAVQVSRSSIRQGDAIRLSVQTPVPGSRVTVRFAGRTWPVYPVGQSAWRTVLGTDPTTRPGSQPITIEVLAASGTRSAVRRDVRVVRVAFPSRRITFEPAQEALLTPEKVAQERKRVEEALRVLHPEQLWQDPLAVPIEGSTGSGYGVLSIYQGAVRGFHGGVDFPVPAGTPVRAAADGIVRLAEALPLSGNAVMIDHGLGVVTSYLHLSAIEARATQRVKKGDMIGRVGSTGLATGPHLHWGLSVNGVRVDPMPWTIR
jgi:murein DD-endopeptidase MepM/ murein hydrolase activator NlpD